MLCVLFAEKIQKRSKLLKISVFLFARNLLLFCFLLFYAMNFKKSAGFYARACICIYHYNSLTIFIVNTI